MPQRSDGRHTRELRPVQIQRKFVPNSAGSALINIGNTRVLCTANIEATVPQFLRDTKQGWLTAEYSMLPGATSTRTPRESTQGKQSGRTIEIQRLIGRSLRQAVDLQRLNEHTIRVDCDVIQADGGTRTAAITGACIAVYDALDSWNFNAFRGWVAAISVGIVHRELRLDLNYEEDAMADTDLNVVMLQNHGYVEIQGTAEGAPLPSERLHEMLALAQEGIETLFSFQHRALEGT